MNIVLHISKKLTTKLLAIRHKTHIFARLKYKHMNKQQILWLVAITICAIAIIVLQFCSYDDLEFIDFIKGFLTGIIIPLTVRFVRECRKKK